MVPGMKRRAGCRPGFLACAVGETDKSGWSGCAEHDIMIGERRMNNEERKKKTADSDRQAAPGDRYGREE